MKKIFYALILTVSVFLLTGCFGVRAKSTAEGGVPKWYTTPPNNNGVFLYGTGAGYSKDDAINSALDNMVSRLSISIQSTYKNKTRVESGEFNSYYKKSEKNIKSEVAKIRVSNYDVSKSYTADDGTIYMLVRSNKDKFFNSLKKELDIKIKKAKDNIALNSNANVLKRYSFYKAAVKNLSSIVPNLLVLNVLNEDFNDKKYLNTIAKLNKDFENLKKSISFYIVADKNSLKLVEPIRVALTNAHLKVVRKKPNSKNGLIIVINSRVKNTKTMGMQVAKFAVDIKISEISGNIIGGNKLSLKGISAQGFELATEDAAKRLQKIIQKKGIGKILGVDF